MALLGHDRILEFNSKILRSINIDKCRSYRLEKYLFLGKYRLGNSVDLEK